MLTQMRTLISSSAAATAVTTAEAAVADPSAFISQDAEMEYRLHTIDTHQDNTGEEIDHFEKIAEAVRREEVEANLMAEQEAGVAVVVAAAETQKRTLEQELEQAGATVEEKEVGSGAVGGYSTLDIGNTTHIPHNLLKSATGYATVFRGLSETKT